MLISFAMFQEMSVFSRIASPTTLSTIHVVGAGKRDNDRKRRLATYVGKCRYFTAWVTTA